MEVVNPVVILAWKWTPALLAAEITPLSMEAGFTPGLVEVHQTGLRSLGHGPHLPKEDCLGDLH